MSNALPENMEKWESVIPGTIMVNRWDPAGGPGSTKTEIVRGGKTFLITPEERNVLNSDRSEPAKDPFQNGMLRPVRSADLAAEVAAEEASLAEQARRAAAPNPNHASDAQLLELFQLRNHMEFRAAAKQITSPQALGRLQELSTQEEANATVSQSKIIAELLAAATEDNPFDIVEVEQPGRIGHADEGDDREGFRPIKI